MKIFVDDKEIEIFVGARIADILRSYSEVEYEDIKKGKKNIYDEFDNRVSLDGAVASGNRYYLRKS